MVCHTKIDPRIVQLQWLCVCWTGILPYFTDHQSDWLRFSWTQLDALRSMRNHQRRKLLLLLQSSKSLKDNASSIGKPQYPQNMHQYYLCDLKLHYQLTQLQYTRNSMRDMLWTVYIQLKSFLLLSLPNLSSLALNKVICFVCNESFFVFLIQY